MKLNQTIFAAISAFFLLNSGSANAQKVSAGSQHSVFLCKDSVPSGWGDNVSGQLGIGNMGSYRTIPTRITALKEIVAVSAANNFTLFLKADGTVWATGYNLGGELGDGTNISKKEPVQISGLTGIIAISAGGSHSLFLKNDGTVWATGRNQNGQLGDGTNDNKNTPVQVSSITNVTAISAGSAHSLFLRSDSTVWICGLSFPMSNTPVQVPNLNNIVKISAGEHYSLYLKSDGTVMASGSNNYGQLGDGTTSGRDTPVAVTSLTGIKNIEASNAGTSFFIKDDGTVWACGINNTGQFGDGNKTGFDPNSTPVKITTLSNVTDIGAGHYHAIFVMADETAKGSGGNAQGQLGDQTTVNSPALVNTKELCAGLVGINEAFFSPAIYAFPNPTNGTFTLKSDKKFTNVTITNLLGETVYFSKQNSAFQQIDLNGQPAGVYFVKMNQGGKIVTQKLRKN